MMMNHYQVGHIIKLIIFLSLLKQGLLWTHYEKGYRGNTDDVCHYDENKNRVCRDLGEHAYRGQLIDGVPKPHEYFMNDAELYEGLKTYMGNGYRGNTDDVCHYDENKNRVCRDLGEHAYRGQLIDGVPKPHEYFMNDAELYEGLKTYMGNDLAPTDSD